MKKQIIMSLIALLPLASIAQPALTMGEDLFTGVPVKTQTSPSLNDNTAATVNNLRASILQMYGRVNNNILFLRGDLMTGRKYAIEVYNLSGQGIYKSGFIGQANTATIDLYRNVEPGLYVVKLWETETANTAILKLSVQ